MARRHDRLGARQSAAALTFPRQGGCCFFQNSSDRTCGFVVSHNQDCQQPARKEEYWLYPLVPVAAHGKNWQRHGGGGAGPSSAIVISQGVSRDSQYWRRKIWIYSVMDMFCDPMKVSGSLKEQC